MKPFFVLIVAVALICVAEQDEANTDLVGRADELLGKCGKTDKDDVYAYYDRSSDTLTIKGSGEMMDYNDSLGQRPWNDVLYQIETVVFKEDVKSVGNFAFFECTSLAKIVISNKVERIGEAACKQCAGLTTLDFDKGSVLKSIGTGAFKGTKVFHVILPNTVTEIGTDAFRRCEKLACVDLNGNVKTIGNAAFAYCPELSKFVFHGSAAPDCKRNVFEGSNSLSVNVGKDYAGTSVCDHQMNRVKTFDLTCLSVYEELNVKMDAIVEQCESRSDKINEGAKKAVPLLGIPGDVSFGGLLLILVWNAIENCCLKKESVWEKRRKLAYDMWKYEYQNSIAREEYLEGLKEKKAESNNPVPPAAGPKSPSG